MKHSLSLSRLLLFVLSAACVSSAAVKWAPRAEDALPTAEEVLDRFIQVTGGKSAYEKLHNEVTSGTVEFVESGVKGKISAYKAEPNKAYRIIALAGVGTIEEGADGNVAWERSSERGPRIKDGEEKSAMFRESAFNAPLRWRELYGKVECVGQEKVGDELCNKLVLTPANGKPVTQYYSEKSGLLVKVVMAVITPTMGEVSTETLLDDYKDVDGVLVPYELRNKVLSQEIHIRVESVQFNVDIPKDRFDLPSDVKTLLGTIKGIAEQ